MRKTDIDLDDARDKAHGVLDTASGDPAYAQQLKNNPSQLLPLLGIPAGEVVSFTIEPNQYCVSVPAIGLRVCIPVITLG
jgi:hypothetical protein